MRYTLALLLTLAALPAAAQHEHHAAENAYAADTARAIKALAPEEVAGLLEGAGLGLARTAELNHFPGPKHVLELADALDLTPEQRTTADRLRADVLAEAVPLGKRIVDVEAQLDRRFAHAHVDAETVRDLLAEIGRLRAELRAVHLIAHIDMRAALTPEQVARYDELRGYTGGAPHQHQH